MCIFLHGLVIFISKAISFYYHNVKSSYDDVLCSHAVCNILAVNTTVFFLRRLVFLKCLKRAFDRL